MQDRESVKELIPILQAYADSKIIEWNDSGTWREIEVLDLNNQFVEYRVQPNDDSFFKENAVEEDDDFTVTEQEEALDELENLRDKLDDIIEKLRR